MKKLNKIKTTKEAREKLISIWGPEVILECSCRQMPSHSMWGQYAPPSCPLCKERCIVILEDWSYT